MFRERRRGRRERDIDERGSRRGREESEGAIEKGGGKGEREAGKKRESRLKVSSEGKRAKEDGQEEASRFGMIYIYFDVDKIFLCCLPPMCFLSQKVVMFQINLLARSL